MYINSCSLFRSTRADTAQVRVVTSYFSSISMTLFGNLKYAVGIITIVAPVLSELKISLTETSKSKGA